MTKTFYCILAGCLLFMVACGGKKKKSMAGEDEVNVEEFTEAYPKLKLPVTYGDSSFPAKGNDSSLIAPEVLHQFIPDSVAVRAFGANAKSKYYPVGRVDAGDGDSYLLTWGVANSRRTLLLTAHDKDKKFIAGIPILKPNKNAKTIVSVTIDPRFNINKDITQKLDNGTEISGHDVYVLNKAARNFMLVMTDSLGDRVSELINPIDTLPKKSKYSGDYGTGKMNLISIRDGQREGRAWFFINLDSDDQVCSGELKGELIFTSENVAEYRQGGDPCVLRFTFSANKVTLEEVEGCGSRLGALQCSFNGDYPKKKEKKETTAKKRAK